MTETKGVDGQTRRADDKGRMWREWHPSFSNSRRFWAHATTMIATTVIACYDHYYYDRYYYDRDEIDDYARAFSMAASSWGSGPRTIL